MKYGEYIFIEDGWGVQIENSKTLRPWINYLSNGEYCALISNRGGGYSFYLDCGKNRITRWEPIGYLSDNPGKYIYIKDLDTNEIFSGTPYPYKKHEYFKCIHRPGNTEITTRNADLETNINYFVPQKANYEIWLAKIKNTGTKTRRLKVYPFTEFLVGNYQTELEIRNISTLFNTGHYNQDLKSIIVTKYPVGNNEYPYNIFFNTSLTTETYEIDLENFLGDEYNYCTPSAIKENNFTNRSVRGVNMTGVFETTIELEPDSEIEFTVTLGITDKKKTNSQIKEIISLSNDIDKTKRLLSDTKAWWKKYIGQNFHVDTNIKNFDYLMNIWIPYQVVMCNHWGRSATYYHEGDGFYGYRNTAQDAFGLLSVDTGFSRKILLKLAQCQKSSGECLHGWSKINGFDEKMKPTSDFPMWLPFLLIHYIKETGEKSILDEQVSYIDGPTATLYEHCVQAMRFLQDRSSGDHNLPLMGTQDWNDALDSVGIKDKGESVMLAMGLAWALKNMETLSLYYGDQDHAAECRRRHEKLVKDLNENAWNGSWYIRGYTDEGKPFGDKNDHEGRIYLNPQVWSILGEVTSEKQKEKVFKVIDNELDTEYGPVMFIPAYTKFRPDIGRISAFAPGTKENAAVFTHTCCFKIVADLISNRPEKAWGTLKKIMPTGINEDRNHSIYKVEPYILPEYTVGLGTEREGEGAFTWLTGSAAWFVFGIMNYMLGFQIEFEGFKIDPKLPADFKDIKYRRVFRNKIYNVNISQTGKRTISLNGIELEYGSLIKDSNTDIQNIIDITI